MITVLRFKDFQGPFTSNSKTFKDLFHFQGLSRPWKNDHFFQGLSRPCGHPANYGGENQHLIGTKSTFQQRFGLVGNAIGCINKVKSTLGPVSTWMGDHQQVSKPSWYKTSHPGQLSLAIPPWVGAKSTSRSWDISRHSARCTSSVSVILQCKLVSG